MNKLGRWIVKRGMPGSTARWAAKMFRYLTIRNPAKSEAEIFETMIRSRYALLQSADKLGRLLAALHKIRGLRDLVLNVLVVESSILEVRPEAFASMMEIVVEELYRKGLTDEDVWGKETPVEIGLALAQSFQELRTRNPKEFLGQIYGAVLTVRYRERHLKQQILRDLIPRTPFIDGLMELVVAVLAAEGKVNDQSVSSIGTQVAESILESGVSPQELFGRSATEVVGEPEGKPRDRGSEALASDDLVSEFDGLFDSGSLSGVHQPHLSLVLGAVAVGKTTHRRSHFGSGYVVLDAGDIFIRLSRGEYFEFPSVLEYALDRIGAHVARRAVRERRNIVTEMIGADFNEMKSLIDNMVAAGYEVDVQYLERDPVQAWESNLNRSNDNISAHYTEPFHRRWLLAALRGE